MKEALKLALEALETCCAGDYSTGHVIDPSFDEDAVNEAITAIKEALAQDELCSSQKPVAEVKAKQDGYGGTFIQQYQLLEHGTKLYTTPPKEQQSCDKRPWVGLTDEEASWCQAPSTIQTWKRIEAKLKELNA